LARAFNYMDDIKDLKSKLDSINITLNKVNETKIEDLLEL